MPGATGRLLERLGKPREEVTTALVDGAGFMGSRLTESANEDFGRVIAVDPRYREASSEAAASSTPSTPGTRRTPRLPRC